MENYKFSRNQRLKSTKDIKKLFSQGEVLLSENFIVKAHVLLEPNDKFDIKFAVGVSKKAGNAVWRNRFKRLVREYFRLNKNLLNFYKPVKILIMITPLRLNQKKNGHLTLAFISNDMKHIFELIREKVLKL